MPLGNYSLARRGWWLNNVHWSTCCRRHTANCAVCRGGCILCNAHTQSRVFPTND